jgi:seryl-tRNA synthetase
MIDLKVLREDPDRVRASQRARGEDENAVDALIDADERRRKSVAAADSLRAEQKTLGKQVGAAQGAERDELLTHAKQLAAEVKKAEAEQASAEQAMEAAHRAVSNLIVDGVPAGG